MSPRRQHGAPPDIPGFTYLSLLGSGGFADVFLYEQDRPRRKVAIKVLAGDLFSESARRRFEAEANLMAELSSHPNIVTIYQAEVSAEGTSYLVMEYCSKPSLDARYRRSRLSVDEVLSIGVQVSSAVESAHRARITHRDIKPANILVTDYDRPALTDFGISGTMDSEPDEDAGMSIPWSPPESFTARNTDGVKVDIWALGATLYTLLAGRSPFVLPGADNSQRALISRIATANLPAISRRDVPQSLELVLATAMSKSAASRYSSAEEFARALRRVQGELGLSLTPFLVREDPSSDATDEDDGEATRVRQIVTIDPETSGDSSRSRFDSFTGTSPKQPQISSVPGVSATRAHTTNRGFASPGFTGEGQGSHTVARGWTPHADAEVEDSTIARSEVSDDTSVSDVGTVAPRSKAKLWLSIVAAAVLAACVVVAVFVIVPMTQSSQAPSSPTAASTQRPSEAMLPNTVPAVTDLKAQPADGGATWSWRNPDPQDGDQFAWSAVSAVDQGTIALTSKTTVFVRFNAQQQSCIQVRLVRKNGSGGENVKKCFPDS